MKVYPRRIGKRHGNFYDTTRRDAMGCIQGTAAGKDWTRGLTIGIWRLGIFTGGSAYLGSLTGELYLYKDYWTLVLSSRGHIVRLSWLGSRSDFKDQTPSSIIEETALKACHIKHAQLQFQSVSVPKLYTEIGWVL